MFKVEEKPKGKTSKIEVYTKTNNQGGKVHRGTLEAEYVPMSTTEANELADSDLLPSEIFDRVVVKVGPVGHPSEKDEQGNPVPLPDEEAKTAVREDFEAMQHVVVDFWEVHSVDPKRKTSRRRR